MAQKDLAEKNLEAFNDVFADIVNVLLFHGERVVRAADLEETSPGSVYKAEGLLHGQERDVAKYWKMSSVRIALYGMENQTEQDEDITLRLFGYDGAAYRAQLLKDMTKVDEKFLTEMGQPQDVKGSHRGRIERYRYPVITLVLYFGTKTRWKKNLSLKERLAMPEELDPFVNDYRANLYEIAWLTEEQVEQFQSDFRIVADYFVQMRKNRQYVPGMETMEHVDAVLSLLSALTQDDRFEEAAGHVKKGERKNMCEVLDFVEERGYNRGVVEGMEKGKLLSLIHQVCRKLQKRKTPDEIAEELEEGTDVILRICEAARAFAPEYNCEDILEKLNV